MVNKIDLIKQLLEAGKLPMLDKDKDYTIQEYMKLKHASIKAIADALEQACQG
ncbi:hypothetical protein [Geobacillus phage TP-84]|uniref:Uncharacterized protein n=1 Tax=Geobacillus phage TP-84 TaxID=1965361 RepID=A0A1U9WQL7_9CAUD|nr:hypothetical protein MUK65_gp50 [Geobacillus phage TP-84]AQY55068.1 hypothetical protein [Geobacillus phage TP-84]